MGAFVFTNKRIDFPKTEIVLKSRGHKDIKLESRNNDTLVFAKKILVNTNNFVSYDSGDYILGIGTYIYKNKYGSDALNELYHDFELKIATETFPIYGHFAMVIRKKGSTYIFTDNEGTLRAFVYQNNGEFIISNSELAIIANINNPQFDKVRLSAFIAAKYCSEVPFIRDVEFLDPRVVYIYKGETLGKVNKTFPVVSRFDNAKEAQEFVLQKFKEQTDKLKAFQGNRFSVELTGGLDSRLISSNIHSAGYDFDFVNYGLYGADYEIASIVSKGLNRNLIMIENKPCLENFKENIGEFDLRFNFFGHYPNKRWRIPNIIQFSGLTGECLSLPEIYTDDGASQKCPTLSKLLPELCLTKLMAERNRTEYLSLLFKYFENKGFKKDDILSEKGQTIVTQLLAGYYSGDYMYITAANASMYFYAMYDEWHFNYYITDIAFDIKDRRKLNIALIKKLDPEIGAFPFVSRLRTRRNSVNGINELTAKYRSYNWAKKALPRILVNYIYGKVGRSFPNHLLQDIDFSKYEDVVDCVSLKNYPNLYFNTLQRLYSLDVVRKQFNIGL
jgi:hypothetical protein